MKSTHYKKVLSFILLLTCFSMFSQETLTKKIEKTFKMTSSGELHLENKYGNITINGWEESNIAITINIRVTDEKKDKAKSFFDRINPNIKASGNYISVITEISDKDIGFFSKYFNKVNPFDFDKSNVEINYTIYLPMNAEVDVKNIYGDMVLDNWTGRLKAELQHGDLWVNTPISNANIDMKFGKLRAKTITYGTINLRNGSINIDDSKDLLLKTSGSSIALRSISNLELTSSKDEISIDHIDNFLGNLQFSNIEVNSIENQINLQMKVSELRIFKINNPDATVTINQESSEVSVNINQLNFKFNATLEEGLLRLPKTFSNVKSDVVDKNNKIRKIDALYGKPTTGLFSFTGKKGIITLKD